MAERDSSPKRPLTPAELAALWERSIDDMPAELRAELDAAAVLEAKYADDVEAELRNHEAGKAARAPKRVSG